jgi:hypothetical protein
MGRAVAPAERTPRPSQGGCSGTEPAGAVVGEVRQHGFEAGSGNPPAEPTTYVGTFANELDWDNTNAASVRAGGVPGVSRDQNQSCAGLSVREPAMTILYFPRGDGR